MRIVTGIITVVLLLALGGCVGTWVKVDGTDQRYESEHFSATLPGGWMRLESGDSLVISRDGIVLQYISIIYRPHAGALEKIEKDTAPDMLPSELAELAIAEIKASGEEGVPSLEVLQNSPVELAGRTGFSLHLRYRTDAGLRMEMLLRGVTDTDGLYLVKYSAPTLYYFERDLPVYERVSGSLQL